MHVVRIQTLSIEGIHATSLFETGEKSRRSLSLSALSCSPTGDSIFVCGVRHGRNKLTVAFQVECSWYQTLSLRLSSLDLIRPWSRNGYADSESPASYSNQFGKSCPGSRLCRTRIPGHQQEDHPSFALTAWRIEGSTLLAISITSPKEASSRPIGEGGFPLETDVQ